MEKKEKIKRPRRQPSEEKIEMIFKKGKKEATSVQETPKYKTLIIFISAVFLLMLIVAGATAYYYYNQYKKALKNPAAENRSELQLITDKLGQFIELPEGEEPTLATVTDIEKIKEQPFFAKAQNGDKVLIYTKNEKAILYRPAVGKIIEISVLSGKEDNAAPVPAAEAQIQGNEANAQGENNQTVAETPAKVSVYNGGRINGLAQKIADSLAETTGIEIAEKTNSQGKYRKTLVIDLSGNRGELTQKIAETLGGEVGAMPEGEIKPEADILIIGGSDFNAN